MDGGWTNLEPMKPKKFNKQETDARRMVVLKVAGGIAAFLAVVAVLSAGSSYVKNPDYVAPSLVESLTLPKVAIKDVYTEKLGRQIGDGHYPMSHIAQVWLETIIYTETATKHKWTVVDPQQNAVYTSETEEDSITVTFTSVGAHTVHSD